MANACFTVLSEKENFERLVKQDKSLAQKVRDFFADFIEKIKNALAGISSRNTEYRALKDDITATGNEFKKNSDGIVAQVSKFFNTLGNKVTTKYGDVILDNKGVKSSLAHGLGRIKATAYKAVPSVLKYGEVINYSKDYNGGKKTA